MSQITGEGLVNSRSILPPTVGRGRDGLMPIKAAFPGLSAQFLCRFPGVQIWTPRFWLRNIKMRIPLVVLLICLNEVFGDDHDYQEQRLFILGLNLSFWHSENIQMENLEYLEYFLVKINSFKS